MGRRIADELPLYRTPADGSTTYSLSIPRQALRLIRERYGENNTAAVIRG